MKKSIFCILLFSLTLLIIGCPKKDKNTPIIEEVTTLDRYVEEYDPTETNTDPPPITQPPVNPPVTSTTTTPTTTTPSKPPTQINSPQQGDFTVQFMALKDRSRVEEVRRILTASAYFTEIMEVEINGETMYRLRLAGSYSRSYAQQLAEKIKSEIAEIDDYWVTRK